MKTISQKPGVNKQFLEQIKFLLKISFPNVKSSLLLASLASILVTRTMLDIWFSSFNAKVIQSITSRNKAAFFKLLFVHFGFMMFPLSITNNLLKLNINLLSLSIRDNLTRFAHKNYFSKIAFYKLSNLDNRINNPDQLLTHDIDKFSSTLAHIYSDTLKPIVDIVLFARKLSQSIGMQAPFVIIGYFLSTAFTLRIVSPPFASFTAKEQKLEGNFRHLHSRVIAHSEEIAFYNGSNREQESANTSFQRIKTHIQNTLNTSFIYGVFDSILVKYVATMTAYYILARPVFNPKYATEFMGKESDDPVKIMEDYSRNSSYLVNLSQAIGRVILAGRDLTRLSGYTYRVADFLGVLESIGNDEFSRSISIKNSDGTESTRLQVVKKSDLKGKVVISDGIIKFDKVDVITPNGDLLVKELNMTVEPGMNTLVTG